MIEKPVFFLAKYKHISLAIFLQFFVLFLAAQVRISGRVTNAESKGIPDISVLVHNTTYGTVTDANGNYSFLANIKPGTYQLDFSGVGFKAFTQSFSASESGTNTVNATLTEDALKMDEVVVTGVSLGTTRRQLGNYIASVNADELSKGATGNVLAA